MAFPLNYTKSSDLAIQPERISYNNVAYCFYNPKDITIQPFEVVKINTGIAFEMIGNHYYGQLVSKKTSFILLGGVIDPGYRGDIIVALINVTDKEQTIFRREVIAQCIFTPVLLPDLLQNISNLQFHVKPTKTIESAFVPARLEDASVGYDLHATENFNVPPLGIVEIDVGVALELKGGPFYAQIRDKSGFSTKRKLHVINGIIDASNNNNPIIVYFQNLSREEQYIFANEQIAQVLFLPVLLPTLRDQKGDFKNLELSFKFSKTIESAIVPKRFDENSVGYNLHAIKDVHVPPLGLAKIDTGIVLKLKGGPFYAQISEKFSPNRKFCHVINGVIESNNNNDSIVVYLKNVSMEEQHVCANEIVAQMVFIQALLPNLIYQEDINRNTTRGDRGFTSGICNHIYT